MTLRTRLAPLLAMLAGVLLAGCASAQVAYAPGVDRSTPQRTYEFFKRAAQAGAFGEEWSVFSPSFKRALNQAVGRNVDFSDYGLARRTVAPNSHPDMQLLLGSTLQEVRMTSPDSAVITITAGGQSLRPRMVRLDVWELRVRGDPDPYSDVLQGGGLVRSVAGGVEVVIPASPTMAPLLARIPPESIESLTVESRWYVDDFGGLESALGSSASQSPGPAPVEAPKPTQPVLPPPSGGYGSPDG